MNPRRTTGLSILMVPSSNSMSGPLQVPVGVILRACLVRSFHCVPHERGSVLAQPVTLGALLKT